jgi:hypothetical protein
MGAKQRLIKAITPRVAKGVLNKEDDMIDACTQCKAGDKAAILACEYWLKKKLYKCPKIAAVLDDVVTGIASDATRPVTEAAMSVGDKIERVKEKIKKTFKKEG